MHQRPQNRRTDPHCIISGGGVAGLLLALALANLGLKVSVYEQAPEYGEGVGGAIGLYANGLRIIRDISPDLLTKLKSYGRDYVDRKWYRHDGSIVAVAKEKYLVEWENDKDEKELASMGIRRWRLQKALADACLDAGIEIFMNSRISAVKNLDNSKVECTLADKSIVTGDIIFGCDGVKSALRTSLFGSASDVEPKYTGITCLMGSAPIAKKLKLEGICFPSSSTTNCHACYYPCNENEVIFQLYFPTEEKPETWKPLTGEEGRKECMALHKILVNDGWAKIFTDPLIHADSVLRVGLRARKPIPVWHSPKSEPRIFLLGDAAHPPVPYIGQGGMMAIEDVGVISMLIKKLCKPTPVSPFNWKKLSAVASLYEKIRLPRTGAMLEASQGLGDMQLTRSMAKPEDIIRKEREIQENVRKHGTLPIMFFGARFRYDHEVDKALRNSKL